MIYIFKLVANYHYFCYKYLNDDLKEVKINFILGLEYAPSVTMHFQTAKFYLKEYFERNVYV